MSVGPFEALRSEIEARGRYATLREVAETQTTQVICASHRNKSGLHGNSFWVSRRGPRWFLVTWMKHFYAIGSESSVADVCCAALLLDDKPLYSLPDDFLEKHALVEVRDDPFGSAER